MSVSLDKDFAVETADRAIKSAAQGVILGFGLSESGIANAFEFDWKLGLGFAAGAAILSVLTSLISGSIFKRGVTSASILPPSS